MLGRNDGGDTVRDCLCLPSIAAVMVGARREIDVVLRVGPKLLQLDLIRL